MTPTKMHFNVNILQLSSFSFSKSKQCVILTQDAKMLWFIDNLRARILNLAYNCELISMIEFYLNLSDDK